MNDPPAVDGDSEKGTAIERGRSSQGNDHGSTDCHVDSPKSWKKAAGEIVHRSAIEFRVEAACRYVT